MKRFAALLAVASVASFTATPPKIAWDMPVPLPGREGVFHFIIPTVRLG